MTAPPVARPTIQINQLLLERATFAHPPGFLSLPALPIQAPRDIQISLQTQIDSANKQFLVRLQLAATSVSGSPSYDLDVSLIGLFAISEFPATDITKQLAVTGGTILFPFAREAIANLTSRGRFGPIWLQPVNLVAAVETATKSTTPAKRPKRKESAAP